MKELNQKLAIVQTKLKAKKSSYNAFGKYYFRKAEDILEAIKPFLLEQGISVILNEELVMTDPVPKIKSTSTIFKYVFNEFIKKPFNTKRNRCIKIKLWT